MISDADASAAHAAGSQLMTSAELCVHCSAPAAAQHLSRELIEIAATSLI